MDTDEPGWGEKGGTPPGSREWDMALEDVEPGITQTEITTENKTKTTMLQDAAKQGWHWGSGDSQGWWPYLGTRWLRRPRILLL